jgi:putative colanic acid biosynthesis UDP-glucose lipid carrier transferase
MLVASRSNSTRPTLANPPSTELLQAALTPLVAIVALLACAAIFGQAFEGAYLILALIVFSLTFPGSAPRRAALGAMAAEVLVGWLTVGALLLFIGWATRTLDYFDPRVIGAWLLATPALLVATYRTLPGVLPRLLAAQGVRRTAVIAGESQLGRELAGRIRANPFLGVRVAGFFEDRSAGRDGTARSPEVLGSLGDLAEYVKRNRVDQIYVTLPMASQPRILKLLDELHDTTASIYFTPDIFLFDLIQARVDSIGGMPVVAVCETPFHGFNRIVKRALDLLLAASILLLISPLLLAIAIGVKLSSPGPVIFKQRRYGIDGKDIMVYKFRSMTVQEDGDSIRQATRNDSRITPFGALLRRTSMDELPQFINVLQGRMSVVGPRPHAVAHNELYRKLIKGYMIRHKVKPGITGLAQVNGLRGETEALDQMQARIDYDLAYLRNWSVSLDLMIVAKTVVVVLCDRNAY